MTPQEILAARARLVAEALEWQGTAYHHLGRIKGVGVDCAMILYEVYTRAGFVQPFPIEPYNPQWHIHRQAERYVNHILTYANEMALPPERIPQPADLVAWKMGRTFSHGAIVIEWPMVLHAFSKGRMVMQTDVSKAKYLTHIGENGPDKGKIRPMKVFCLKEWC